MEDVRVSKEIEITPEMTEAGKDELYAHTGLLISDHEADVYAEACMAIYRAMA
jgi:hypothetical protein